MVSRRVVRHSTLSSRHSTHRKLFGDRIDQQGVRGANDIGVIERRPLQQKRPGTADGFHSGRSQRMGLAHYPKSLAVDLIGRRPDFHFPKHSSPLVFPKSVVPSSLFTVAEFARIQPVVATH